MENFTPGPAFLGGLLIGAAAALLLIVNGRIAGISGIVGGLFQPVKGDVGWRAAFVGGLISAPLIYALASGSTPSVSIDEPAWLLVAAGLLVGFGTRLGAGCTSGHGVCGIGRASRRSIVSTAIFMAAAILTVAIKRHLIGV